MKLLFLYTFGVSDAEPNLRKGHEALAQARATSPCALVDVYESSVKTERGGSRLLCELREDEVARGVCR